MMLYQIKNYTKEQAELGLQVKPSLSTGKKIDVYDGKKVASVGDLKV
jgi:hypothetical protein